MTDEDLLKLYLAWGSPEAAPWNLSPDALLAACATHELLRQHVPARGSVCNIGIGTGQWDDYLGYWLRDAGALTSIDINSTICETLAYRQRREGHPYPTSVVACDLLENGLSPESFDVVTMIGSTLHETGSYEAALDAAFALLVRGGVLFYMDYARFHAPEQFEGYAERTGHKITLRRDFTEHEIIETKNPDELGSCAFYVFIVQGQAKVAST